jgi:hypothetical protein
MRRILGYRGSGWFWGSRGSGGSQARASVRAGGLGSAGFGATDDPDLL